MAVGVGTLSKGAPRHCRDGQSILSQRRTRRHVFSRLGAGLGFAHHNAALVISPLTFGSGLKIKLIEALARGKAVVATSITLQGVEAECNDAVIRADDPHDFADAIIALNADDTRRGALATTALAAARAHFSAEACYGGFARWSLAVAPEAKAETTIQATSPLTVSAGAN